MRFNRKQLRIVLLWISLFLLLRLADYSVSAAFLGDEPAQKLFNSVGMFLFWLVFLGSLLVTVFFLPYRGLGLTTMHIGCGVVLLGGILGSQGAHKYLYDGRMFKGYMQISEGESSSKVFSAMREPLADLDFELALEDFSIERYKASPEEGRWEIWAGLRAADPQNERPSILLRWETGKPVSVPYTDMALEVLSYEQREIPRPPGVIVIHSQSDGTVFLPAVVGRRVELPRAQTTVTVNRVFRGLQMDSKTMQLVDDPSRGFQPAAVLDFQVEGQEPTQDYAFSPQLNARMDRPTERIFVPIENPDMQTMAVPTIKIRLRNSKSQSMVQERVVTPAEGMTQHPVALDFMYSDEKAYRAAGEPVLALREPTPTVKTFESKVAVKRDNQVVERASIRVNHPLHYDGYHFYQSDYDHEGHTYTVLSVVSSRGMRVVYVGFSLLFLGTAWYCWVEFFVRRKSEIGDRGSNRRHPAVE